MTKKMEVSVPDETVMNKIYLIRGQKVMLDRDLAELYGVKARRLREQLKRNFKRFPQNFVFQLSEKEAEFMVSQNATPSMKYLGGSLPYVFTEHGVLMLANILKSEQAIIMSVKIIEIFVRLREMIMDNTELRLEVEKIKKKMENQEKNTELVFQYLDELLKKKETPKREIGFIVPGI